MITESGENYTFGADELNDFDNIWRQSAEYSVPGGQGLDKPSGNWTELFAEARDYMKDRLLRPTLSGDGGGDMDKDGDGWRD